MDKLNLPPFDYRIRQTQGQLQIFDVVRRRYVALTPEEWVRQHVLHDLLGRGYSRGRIKVETSQEKNERRTRTDIEVVDSGGQLELLIECKRSDRTLSLDDLNQLRRYLMQRRAKSGLLTNGIHFWTV